MSSTMKTPEHIVPACNLPRGRAVDRGKVAEAAQQTAEAEVSHAAQAAQVAEGRMVLGDSGEGRKGDDPFGCTSRRATVMSTTRSLGRDPLTAH